MASVSGVTRASSEREKATGACAVCGIAPAPRLTEAEAPVNDTNLLSPVPTRESARLLRRVLNEVARIRGATGVVITTAYVHPADLKACELPRTFTWLGVKFRECGELRPGDIALLVATKDGPHG